MNLYYALQEGTYEIFKLVNLLNADGLNARFAKNNPESYARIVAATGAAPFNSV